MELFTPDFGLIFWMFVAFAILFFLLWKFAWPMILKTVDHRADLIDKGVEYAHEAQEQLKNAQQQSDAYMAEARRKQADILREADKMKTQIIEEARTAAQTEAQKVMDSAKLQIEQQQKEEMALEIAGKVVKTQLEDDKNQTKLVGTLLDELESKK